MHSTWLAVWHVPLGRNALGVIHRLLWQVPTLILYSPSRMFILPLKADIPARISGWGPCDCCFVPEEAIGAVHISLKQMAKLPLSLFRHYSWNAFWLVWHPGYGSGSCLLPVHGHLWLFTAGYCSKSNSKLQRLEMYSPVLLCLAESLAFI